MLFSLLLGLFPALPFRALECLEHSTGEAERRPAAPTSSRDAGLGVLAPPLKEGTSGKSLLLSGTLSPAALHNLWGGFSLGAGRGSKIKSPAEAVVSRKHHLDVSGGTRVSCGWPLYDAGTVPNQQGCRCPRSHPPTRDGGYHSGKWPLLLTSPFGPLPSGRLLPAAPT